MVTICEKGAYLFNGREVVEDRPENQGLLMSRLAAQTPDPKKFRMGTMACRILAAHHAGNLGDSPGDDTLLRLNFDCLASHDITFVNIIQTAKVSGLERFPVPYVLTNCHNSLCAVGGTINEDDHMFGLSAARKYGGIYVPPHLAVIHSYIRETQAGCGKMILGSDSHTRYGALGTMGVGEGGGELVKQLLGQTYDISFPRISAVYLSGKPRPGVGPQDVALAIVGAVFKNGFVKNKVLEFVGDGIAGLSADYRAGIDVMTTETACWSSIWETDEVIRDFLIRHGREGEYQKLSPQETAYYDGLIRVDLSRVKPMIALPFHPSNTFEIDTFNANPGDILRKVEQDASALIDGSKVQLKLTDKIDEKGRVRADQGIIAGCAGGTFDNIMAAASMLRGRGTGKGPFSLSVYPGSQPVMLELAKNGALADLTASGAVIRTAFCGPCFGAGDVPANNALSVRHTTRNFPNREGSKPANGQIASVALMDARSVAATALNGGYLCSAESLDISIEEKSVPYRYDDSPYKNRVYNGVNRPDKGAALCYGPNITDWPSMEALGENLLVKIVSFITDPVTTTDEIIPSGETSSFRSNPLGLAEYTLSRKDPGYVGRTKAVQRAEKLRAAFRDGLSQDNAFEEALPELPQILAVLKTLPGMAEPDLKGIQIGSAIFAHKPGDGSAREQAASCQRVLGGLANFAHEYATKRYKSNLINWGILPFVLEGTPVFKNEDYIFIPRIREKVTENAPLIGAYILTPSQASPLNLKAPELSPIETEIILDGGLINRNRRLLKEKS
jgi:aconitate hydratase